MNPFSPYAKPFTNPSITGFQPIRNPIHQPIPRNDNSNTSASLNPLGFQPTHFPGSIPSQRCPPSHDPYPNKRVRHSQESYTEVFPEGSTPVTQARSGAKLEEQRPSQASIKGLDQGFSPLNSGFRKTQNNFSFGMQENSSLQSNPIFREAMNMMLLRQCFSRSRKDALSRENDHNPTQATFQNEPAYSMLGNNLNLTSLFPNTLNLSHPPSIEFLRQLDLQSALLQYQQHLVNQQLLYNLQDSSAKGNPNLRNSGSDGNSPLMRIPPFSGQNILEYMATSPLAANNINALLRSEIRDKTILNETNLEEELKKFNPNQAVETSNRVLKAMDGPQEDQKENRPPGSKFELNDLKMKQENVCNNIVLQSIEDSKVSNVLASPSETQKNQKRKASLIQKEVGTISDSKKELGLRKKNKWQMMIDTNEEGSFEGSPAVGSSNKARMSTKSDQSTRPNLRVSSAFRKLSNTVIKTYEEPQEKIKSKKSRYESSSHRKKKAMKAAAKMKSEAESLQNKLNAIVEGRLNFEKMREDENQISIASSYGRNPEEFVLDEKDQNVVETRVGKEYQAKDLELDMNPASLAATKRVVNLAWDPESFEREVLEAYFEKLQSILSCNEINEEKAIKMLLKKNMVQEEVIVTIKKNEKFYSSFLGASHTQKNSKNKKNSEDRK